MKFSKRSLERMEGIDDRLLDIMSLALIITKIDFGIPEYGGLRSPEEQHNLYKKGVSKADGYELKSDHQSGKAIDVYAYIGGAASWKEEHLAMVACAVLQAASQLRHKIKWGGLWSSKKETNGIPYGWDMAHFKIS